MAIRRVSLGPGEVAGYFSQLKSGFDELGIPSEHFLLSTHPFSYRESPYFLSLLYKRVAPLRGSGAPLKARLGWGTEIVIRGLVFIYAIIRCDVFIFSGFESFFKFHELFLLRLLKKRIIVVFFGSDARPPLFSGRHLDGLGQHLSSNRAYHETISALSRINKIEKFSHIIINHTATAQFFSREFIRFSAIGLPIIAGCEQGNSFEATRGKRIRILHAPSRPKAKGSAIIRKMIHELKSEGYPIEWIELVNVPNKMVLDKLQQCDFVIDEVYSDLPLGMLGAEAAMLSKPVILSGYYANQFRKDNPDLQIPPSVYVNPSDLKHYTRMLIENQGFRKDLGDRANRFVSNNWNCERVAERYVRIILNDIPASWFKNPQDLDYCFGWGLSKDIWRKQVREYVLKFGTDALFFNHNPMLKKRVLNHI